MTKQLDINKFSKLCNRVEELNKVRDDELIRPSGKVLTSMTISNCMDELDRIIKEPLDTLVIN